MKKIILLLALLFAAGSYISACTSAIVSGSVTRDGRPLLWKHRDTGDENNKVERIPAKGKYMEYVALYNSKDKKCKEAWMGYNSAGFAIMNTASYNLKDDNVPEKKMDKEGVLMTLALQRCKTIQDFKNLLDTLKRPMGVEANFGVIDAQGNGGYFETNNTKYTFYDLKDSKDGVLVRTNYSHSGRKNEGYGYIREDNANQQLAEYIKNKNITPATFTEVLSRRFYHSLLGADYTDSGLSWVIDQDFIPRKSSTATTVIEGVNPGENPLLTTMWIGLGYPPCSEIRYVWLGENGVPSELTGIGKNGHSPLCDSVVAKKHRVFSITRGSGSHYVNLEKLYRKDQTGFCQEAMAKNIDIYKKGESELAKRRLELNKK